MYDYNNIFIILATKLHSYYTINMIMLTPNILYNDNSLSEKPKFKYLSQLALLLLLLGGALLIAGIVQFIIGITLIEKNVPIDKWGEAMMTALNNPKNANAMRWMQLLSAFVMFFLPAFLWSIIISKNAFKYLGFNAIINAKQIAIVVAISFMALILSGALGELNQMIPISKEWASTFKKMENAYNDQITSIIHMSNVAEYFFVLIVIAFAPAIFEEVLFRGGLQQLLTNWTKRPLLAIIITSIIFSAVHLSYYGFLPRLALGLVLGLLYYYGKNIWLNILMHLLNNGISVTAVFLLSKNGKLPKEVIDETFPIYYGIIPLIAIVFLLKLFKKESTTLQPQETIVYLKREENPFDAQQAIPAQYSEQTINTSTNDGTEPNNI